MADRLRNSDSLNTPLCDDAARFYLNLFSAIPQDELRAYLLSQRWFRSKGEKITAVSVFDAASAQGTLLPALLMFLQIDYAGRGPEIYFAPYVVLDSKNASVSAMTEPPLLSFSDNGTKYLFFDAFLDGNFNSWLFKQMTESAALTTCSGLIRFQPEADSAGLLTVKGEVKKMKGEQSNTSLVADKTWVLKVIRMADREINPEADMLRYLTRCGYKNVPQFRGDAIYQTSKDDSSTFAILVDFVKSRSDGWEFTLQYLDGYYGRHAAGSSGEINWEAAERDIRSSLPEFEELGRVTAEMHHALASDTSDPLFLPESSKEADAARWLESFTTLLNRTSGAAEAALKRELPASSEALYREFLNSSAAINRKAENVRRFAARGILKIRYHGDYHLGQVLKTEKSWCVTDFEGEPLRSIAERKQKTSPLKDVAGMLRSFSYAAYVSEYEYLKKKSAANLRGLGSLWHELVRGAYLNAYRETAGSRGGLFALETSDFMELLSFFELEKAVYELNYEINNRPDWAHVPLSGIKRLAAGT